MAPTISKSISIAHNLHFLFPLLLMSARFILTTTAVDVTYNVPEEQPSHTFVGNVARDINLHEHVTADVSVDLQFSILASPNSHGELFFINASTSDLFTARVLDKEALCRYELECRLDFKVGAVSSKYFRNIRVRVLLLDVNDNAPRFNRTSVLIEIPESANSGAAFSLGGAVDDDTGANNSVQSYTLLPAYSPFSITFAQKLDRTSDVTLFLDTQLDREVKASYSLKLVASDGGVPLRTAVLSIEVHVIDVNDNAPKFTSSFYATTIGENVQPDAVIMTVSATDADEGSNAQVRYRLSTYQDESTASIFSIRENTGEISLQRRPLSGRYSIIVEAVDNGIPPKEAQVVAEVSVIDTTNNPPVIAVSVLNERISEGIMLQAPVAHVSVEDPDSGKNGQVSCFSQSAFFDLRRLEENDIMVEVARQLDREENPSYSVTLFCQDDGSPQLNATAQFVVNIDDINDNPPVFVNLQESVSVLEGNRVREVVITLTATDRDAGPNAEISFHLLEDGEGTFSIPPATSSIVVAKPLDRETIDHFILIVLAVDGGSPRLTSTTTLTINIDDLNDECPVFKESKYTFTVPENTLAGTLIGTVSATDADLGDSGKVSFALDDLQIFSSSLFSMFPNGSIVIKDRLDREASPVIVFDVIAVDGGLPQQTSRANVAVVLLDVNDNEPLFIYPSSSNSSITLYAPIPADTLLFSVQAMDADEGRNGELSYSCTSVNMTSLFSLDPRTGDVLAKQTIGEEYVGAYIMTCTASDKGDIPLSTSESLMVSIRVSPDFQSLLRDDHNGSIVTGIVCATVFIAVTVILVAYYIRRRDRQKRRKYASQENQMNTTGDTRAQSHIRQRQLTLVIPSANNHDSVNRPTSKVGNGISPGSCRFFKETDTSCHWDTYSVDIVCKDELDGFDIQALNRVTSLRLQQAFQHISSIKTQLITGSDTGKPYEWREIHVPGRLGEFRTLSSPGSPIGDSGLGTDEVGTQCATPSPHSLGSSAGPGLSHKVAATSLANSQLNSESNSDSNSSLPNLYWKPGSDILVFRPSSPTSSPSDMVEDNCTTTSGSYSVTLDDGVGYGVTRDVRYVHDVYV